MGVTMSLPTHLKILLLASSAVFLGSCSSRAIHEAEAVVAQADSLWQAGLMYGIDAGDSLTLAQAYETLQEHSVFSSQLSEVCPFVPCTSLLRTYAHACYHYGKLLRAKDHPAEAMQAFINATHSRTRDYHILGRVYSNMGSICHLAGDFPLSYDMYEKSANCFLADKDTLSYYYGLNNMAFEKAMFADKESCLGLLHNIEQHCIDGDVICKTLETKAEMYLKCKQYDSVLYYAHKNFAITWNTASALLIAQAYDDLEVSDSALIYANWVLSSQYASQQEKFNTIYIVLHNDSTLDADTINALASLREDIRYYDYEPEKEKLSHTVQLLEKDLNYSPDLTWLYVLIATLILVGATLGIYVYCKQKKQALLSQKIDKLEKATSIIQEKHDELSARYSSNYKHIEEDINRKCAMLQDKDKIVKTLSWKNYDKMCVIVDKQFYLLASKLRSKQVLNETEIRLCVLTLLDCGYDQMAKLLYRSPSSMGTLKIRVAKKLGTTSKNLRLYLIENECIS